MAHYSISRLLQSAFRAAVHKDAEALALYNDYQESRRIFLKQVAVAAGSIVIAPPILSLSSCKKNENENIAIIGAGIAGLNAAYQLQKLGIKTTVYEAAHRLGGRIRTISNEFGKGITTEAGGEFVDASHSDIIQLVNELGLSFYDLKQDHFARKTYYFGGREIEVSELQNALKPFVSRLMRDIGSLPENITYKTASKFEHLDQQSITGYLTAIGIQGWLFDFLNVTLTREYGMEASAQSAVNFLVMFREPGATEKGYELFGPDHEVLKIKGGNQQLINALHEKVKESVKIAYKLTAINKGGEGGYELTFDNNGSTAKISATRVILAIPFTILRQINSGIPMHPSKRKCIDEMGYGNSSKFIMGVNEKPWRSKSSQGYTFTDLSFGCGWDSSQMQSESEGAFTVFGGGDFSNKVLRESDLTLTSQFLPDLNTIYPGMDKAFNKKTRKFCWSTYPHTKAAYSSFKTGQWSTLAGWEGVPVGEIYFAGEHVSRDFQGYMNGGAQTGRIAAEMMMNAMAVKR